MSAQCVYSSRFASTSVPKHLRIIFCPLLLFVLSCAFQVERMRNIRKQFLSNALTFRTEKFRKILTEPMRSGKIQTILSIPKRPAVAMIDRSWYHAGNSRSRWGKVVSAIHYVGRLAARCLRQLARTDLSPQTLVNSPSTSCFFARGAPWRFYRRKTRQATASSRQLRHVSEGWFWSLFTMGSWDRTEH